MSTGAPAGDRKSSVGTAGVPVPPEVDELLGDDALGIGVVVPMVVSPLGRVLEAGAFGPLHALVARGCGSETGQSALRVRRDVDGTTFPWVAVRADTLAAARRRLTADADGSQPPQAVVDAILQEVSARGQRVSFEPGWKVTAATDSRPTPGPATLDTRLHRTPGSNVLLVTGFVPSDRLRSEDRALQSLVVDLLANTVDTSVTVVAVDGFRAEPAAQALRNLGAEVVYGPVDWGAWFAERGLSYTNVIVTWSGLQSDLRGWLRRTQPQAVVTLYLPSLPERDIEALRAYAPADELSGLELVRANVRDRLLALGDWVDTVWCDHEGDASTLRASGRFPVVSVIPADLAAVGPDSGPTGPRRGLVLLANEGHDVIKGNEEATLLGLAAVLTPLRRRWPDLPCAVVTERPTPRLESTCRELAVTIVAMGQADKAIAEAELVIVPHQHGTGGGTAIAAAIGAGTAFLATPQAANDVDLGSLRAQTVFPSVEDLVLEARRLIGDPSALSALTGTVRDTGATWRAGERRRTALRAALPPAGLSPTHRPGRSWPDHAIPGPVRPPLVLAPLRPDGWSGEPESGGPTEDDQESRYREWARRFGPTPATLAAIEADLSGAKQQPLVSILMPVCNTEPWMLKAALDSVVDQLYRNWQLCIADDGSDRPETIAVLDQLAADPAVRIVRLPGRSGIAAATNAALAVADGEYVTFLDHDDVLKPHALAQVVRWINADPSLDIIYSDEDKLDGDGRLVQPYLKPHWSPDLLRTHNYICHLAVIRRSLVDRVGGLRSAFDGSQDHDLLLRVTELTDRIAHIPEPLYSWRITEGSAADVVDAKPYALEASKRALDESLERRQVGGRVEGTSWAGRYRTRYNLIGQPKVAIVIPTKDRLDLLERCVESVLTKSTYRNYELALVDNQTTDGDALGYLASLPGQVFRYPHTFNYARMINLAAASIEADALLFLNNDTEVITPEWIEALLEHAMRPEVGAVGGRLYFGEGHLQHEGIYVGIGGWASNVDHGGLHLLGNLVRNTSAVTGACTMMRPSVYWRVGGNDERLRVAYNDVDICLRIRQAGLEVVYTPHAELFHYESASRSGYEHQEDGPLFGLRWEPRDRVDPYYSPVYHRDHQFRIGLGEPVRTMPG